MNFTKFQNKIIVCLNRSEIKKLFKDAKIEELNEEIKLRDITFDDLHNNEKEMIRISEKIAKKTAEDRNDHEFFAAAYSFLDFYEAQSQVCFELTNNFNFRQEKINTLRDLVEAREMDTLSDFIIKSNDGFRIFQLKRYRGKLDTESIYEFMKEKLKEYGNDLGNVNLLIVLQVINGNITKVDFRKIHKELRNLNLRFESQILISYNENNKFLVINQVYPELNTSRIPTN